MFENILKEISKCLVKIYVKNNKIVNLSII